MDQSYVKKHKAAYHPPAGEQIFTVQCDICNVTYSSKASVNQVIMIFSRYFGPIVGEDVVVVAGSVLPAVGPWAH